ncbi:hypothetical protein ACIBF7_03055 [Nonomuraea sp. NPDC050478]|uniref:hypothetical protein n=1 Tax=Nonomuraea sp. NPDC050478 TaxID=3364365 RepID=UPI0037AE970F
MNKKSKVIVWISIFFGGLVSVALIIHFTLQSWAGSPLEVDPAAAQEVKNIGKVKGEVVTQFQESDVIVVTRNIILDGSDLGAVTALHGASKLLQSKNWNVVARLHSGGLQFESDRWENTLLTIEQVGSDYHFYDQSVEDAAKEARASMEHPDALLLVRLRRTDV